MTEDILQNTKKSMNTVIESTKKEFASVRTGRANPAILDRLMIDYYGTSTPINQLATVSVPESRLLMIQPFDKSSIKEIEKAILSSGLGLTPTNDGNVIRIQIPQLTEERRKDLVRMVRKEAESGRVAVRNIRRQANSEIKDLEKSSEISEDDSHRTQEEVQEITDKFIEEIDKLLEKKEAEIMEV